MKHDRWIVAIEGVPGIDHAQDASAALVAGALHHFANVRYSLLAWVVMPNHVHAIVALCPGESLASTVQSWKSFSAKRANALLSRSGAFWQTESFDRLIRSEGNLRAAIHYVEMNPVMAGLCRSPDAWPFSSAGPSAPRAFPSRSSYNAASQEPP